MQLIPVIDLQHGVVVRGVAGDRQNYRPIQSKLVDEPSPGAIAAAFAMRFGFSAVYVADLDAIAGREPNLAAYEPIRQQSLALWLDAGIRTQHDAVRITTEARLDPARDRLVVGSESLATVEDLQTILQQQPAEQIVFSLDLKAGRINTPITAWQQASPATIVSQVVALGIEQLIVLDLADVGTDNGTRTLELVSQLHATHPRLCIIAGGGVRSVTDLRELNRAGCSAALVASALHDGRLRPDDLRDLS